MPIMLRMGLCWCMQRGCVHLINKVTFSFPGCNEYHLRASYCVYQRVEYFNDFNRKECPTLPREQNIPNLTNIDRKLTSVFTILSVINSTKEAKDNMHKTLILSVAEGVVIARMLT